MQPTLFCLCGLVIALLAFAVPDRAAGAPAGTALYVAPGGRDTWSGKRPAPNASRTDGPLATLEAARDAVRALRRAGKLPDRGVTVHLRGGVYPRADTFALTAEDSGAPGRPVVYRAYRNETVRLVGGREVTGWRLVTDAAVRTRLDEAARGQVMVADLRAQGIADFGALRRRGFGAAVVPAGLELFFQDRPMTLARWPNGDDWAKIAGAPGGSEGGRFTYAGDRPKRWMQAEDVWVHGYWTYDWADTYEKVRTIDPEKSEIATEPPHGAYGYTPGKRWYALNLLEELDTPGEWYLDRKAGLLYFWPPAPLTEGKAVVSTLETPLVTLQDVSHVTLRGLTLEATRGAGVEARGGEGFLLAGCTLRNIGTTAVSIEGGSRHRVLSCDITETGDSGIQVSGGDRQTLQPAGHEVVNCHIHHYSRWSRTYRPAVGVNGVGIRVAHCRIHDAPHNAILFGGNDHLFELNDVARVCTQTGDAGAFYAGRNLTMRGTVIRHNRFHDIGRVLDASATGFVEVMAVYLDDCYCGTTVYGNLFLRAGRAAMIGGGRDNVIENNVFVECDPAIHVDQRGTGWAAQYFNAPNGWGMPETLRQVPFDRAPYTRYPHMANLPADEPAKAKYNRIIRNIGVNNKRWIEWLDGLSEQTVEVRDNWTEGDPGFVAPQKGDYRLKKDAPARRIGFQPIPVEKIGLYRDEYRRSLPR